MLCSKSATNSWYAQTLLQISTIRLKATNPVRPDLIEIPIYYIGKTLPPCHHRLYDSTIVNALGWWWGAGAIRRVSPSSMARNHASTLDITSNFETRISIIRYGATDPLSTDIISIKTLNNRTSIALSRGAQNCVFKSGKGTRCFVNLFQIPTLFCETLPLGGGERPPLNIELGISPRMPSFAHIRVLPNEKV